MKVVLYDQYRKAKASVRGRQNGTFVQYLAQNVKRVDRLTSAISRDICCHIRKQYYIIFIMS
jgi:hypothetical protein